MQNIFSHYSFTGGNSQHICLCRKSLPFPLIPRSSLQNKLICQHNNLSPSSPSWNVSVCTCSLLLFLWPTVNTQVYIFFRCSSHSVLLLSWVLGWWELCVFSQVRREQMQLNLEIAATVLKLYKAINGDYSNRWTHIYTHRVKIYFSLA